MKKSISASLALSLLLGVGTTFVVPLQNKIEAPKTQLLSASISSKVNYNDYQDGQYWSKDILWAVDNGLIQGYLNTTHPTSKLNKTIGNWLNPSGQLTEAQAVAILFRYAKPDELAKMDAQNTEYWAKPAYQLAEKYQIPTQSTSINRAYAEKIVTRGALARSIASLHFKKPVSDLEAVRFMYEADLSDGYPDSSGSIPKTYESYGIEKTLTRAHITTFLKRYDNYVNGTGGVREPVKKPVVDAGVGSSGEVNFAKPGATVLKAVPGFSDAMTVQYGTHTYFSRNQSVYDQVMTTVKTALKKDYQNIKLGKEDEQHWLAYLDGTRGIRDRDNRDPANLALLQAEGELSHFVDAGVSKSDIIKLSKVASLANSIVRNKSELGNNKPNSTSNTSAYPYSPVIFHLVEESEVFSAQIYSAALDTMGYNTRIIIGWSRAIVLVQIKGEWYIVQGVNYSKVDLPALLSKDGIRYNTPPTFGGIK